MKSKLYELSGWDLSDLLESTETSVIQKVTSDLEKAIQEVEARREYLTPNINQTHFKAFIDAYEHMVSISHHLVGYAILWFSSDTQSQEALGFKGKVDQLMLDLENRTLFFSIWWKDLDEENTNRLMAEAGDLTYYLQQLRNFKPYLLSENEEQIINMKDVNGIDAVITLYDMITNKLKFQLEVDGEVKTFTREALSDYVRDPDPAMRKAAYDELYRVYGENETVLAQIYQYRVRDWHNEQLQLRSFDSAITVRNRSNDLPDSVVDTLLEVIEAEAPVFHRYFALKAKWLNLPKLRRYDLYAPLNTSNKKVDYNEAVNLVLESFEQFSPVIGQHARRVFEDNHIDSEMRETKTSGAFCLGLLPKISPFVLMNYTGEVRSVATLAHELGHAVHAMLAEDHSILTFHSALPMAETASVFAETMLTDRLLRKEPDPEVRRDLLAASLDDTYATVLRQAYFVIFEREAHQAIMAGQTAKELNNVYLDNLNRQFGDVVEIDEVFAREWISIPHIYHVPFYCYAHSFGQLMALSLYQRYKEEGESFVPKYLKILAYGGSAKPSDILEEVGIDINDPNFWHGGFRVIERMLSELEEI